MEQSIEIFPTIMGIMVISILIWLFIVIPIIKNRNRIKKIILTVCSWIMGIIFFTGFLIWQAFLSAVDGFFGKIGELLAYIFTRLI